MAATTDYSDARVNMVEGQIRPNKVTDLRLVDAFLDVPRELFVPRTLRGIAYVDEDVPLGDGRYLMEPMVLGRLLQAAGIGTQDVVLDVGCGTGYSAAVIGRLAATVVAVESDATLAATAGRALREAGADNVLLMQGPLEQGWPAQQPYDVILIDGAVAEVPEALLDQLAEGGRLVTVVAASERLGLARIYQKVAGIVSSRPLFDATVHPLPGFQAKPGFQF
ncbi:protein-L-isoaspartate O-methyltransferase family protein [Rhodocista pekingensis]|uniref:Protein-L-isoaspartate O-methyltransferase n=1 Tax=Rhodocista pekingensis TaxID=201185 RepID=A0ABW2KPT4_9PROT